MTMTRRIFVSAIGWCALSALLPGADEKGKGKGKDKGKDKDNKDGKDDVVGALWEYTLTREGRKESGQFRVFQREIFRGGKKVGSVYIKDNDESSFKISGWPEMNGEATIRKVKQQPVIWKGDFTRENGQKWNIELEIKDK
jgi:hypothetical protein